MAASKRKSAGLTRFESIAGGIFLAFYLLLLPVTRTLLFRLLDRHSCQK